jgi:hypothetical protein
VPSETPSPIRDEGWFGPGGRRFLAIGITLIVLAVGAYYLIGGREEIGDFLDELSTTSDEPTSTTTLEDTTSESGGPAPPEPGSPPAWLLLRQYDPFDGNVQGPAGPSQGVEGDAPPRHA